MTVAYATRVRPPSCPAGAGTDYAWATLGFHKPSSPPHYEPFKNNVQVGWHSHNTAQQRSRRRSYHMLLLLRLSCRQGGKAFWAAMGTAAGTHLLVSSNDHRTLMLSLLKVND